MLKNWLLNIGIALAGFAVIIWLMFLWMNWYTKHNIEVELPNLKGVEYSEAIKKLEDLDLRYEIVDSVYKDDFKHNAITEQDPPALSEVKPNRIIYLTINALPKPKVKMPKLVDQSFTLGKAVLKNAGLVLGEVTYKFDEIGHNLVVEQLYKGQPVLPGKMLDKGSVIDLVISTSHQNSSQPDTLSANDPNSDLNLPDKIEEKPKKKSSTKHKPTHANP